MPSCVLTVLAAHSSNEARPPLCIPPPCRRQRCNIRQCSSRARPGRCRLLRTLRQAVIPAATTLVGQRRLPHIRLLLHATSLLGRGGPRNSRIPGLGRLHGRLRRIQSRSGISSGAGAERGPCRDGILRSCKGHPSNIGTSTFGITTTGCFAYIGRAWAAASFGRVPADNRQLVLGSNWWIS